jgi:hypothetical protein
VRDVSEAPEVVLDDPAIPDTEVVYRRLYPGWIVTDTITGQRRPISGAFEPDSDGVSVYLQSILMANDLAAADVALKLEQSVAGVDVGELRSIGLGIKPDPWPADVPDPDHKRNAAHALIQGLNALGAKAQLKRRRQLANLPSMRVVHN